MRQLLAMNMLLLAAFLWRGCASDSNPTPAPVPSGNGGSAGSAGTGGDSGRGGAHPCERACARLAQFGCAEAKPTPNGASCVSVCLNVEDSGIVTLDPECVAKISSCAEVERCTSSGQ